MDKIKFVMTNTSDIVTEVCREALEAKGVTVMVCDKNGTAALETLLARMRKTQNNLEFLLSVLKTTPAQDG